MNNEYNLDIPLNLPAGKHLIEITNTSLGWVYLDWVRLEQVLPSAYSGNWQPSPDAIGLRGPRESLLYVVAPWVSFSGSSTNAVLPMQHGQSVMLTNWPPGKFLADWYDPLTGTNAGSTQAITTNGTLTLPLPDFSEDLVGIVHPPATLTALGMEPASVFQFRLDSETGGNYLIQKSTDLLTWLDFEGVSNSTGTLSLFDSIAGAGLASVLSGGAKSVNAIELLTSTIRWKYSMGAWVHSKNAARLKLTDTNDARSCVCIVTRSAPGKSRFPFCPKGVRRLTPLG